jgi:hypothetical protein
VTGHRGTKMKLRMLAAPWPATLMCTTGCWPHALQRRLALRMQSSCKALHTRLLGRLWTTSIHTCMHSSCCQVSSGAVTCVCRPAARLGDSPCMRNDWFRSNGLQLCVNACRLAAYLQPWCTQVKFQRPGWSKHALRWTSCELTCLRLRSYSFGAAAGWQRLQASVSRG